MNEFQSSKMQHNTVVVNLFAGAGAGKTTCAWEIASDLKKHGFVVEYVSEKAKEYVWDNNLTILDGSLQHQHQLYTEQNHAVQRLMGKVDVIVTDSPILLNSIYLKTPNAMFNKMILDQFQKQRNFNIFVERGSVFETEGRIHTLEQSKEIDKNVLKLLDSNSIYYGKYTYDKIKTCVNNIETTVHKAQNLLQTNSFDKTTALNNPNRNCDINKRNKAPVRKNTDREL